MEPVSIILKTWNASQHVRLCLQTLLENTNPPYELIIVDNGSKPRLKEYLRQVVQTHEQVRLVENERNAGPGWANRQGAEAASYRLLCLLDSDVLLPPGWLERLVGEMEQNLQVKLLAPLQPEEAVVYPFENGETNSRQMWYEVRHLYADYPHLEQFRAYTRGASLAEFEQKVLAVNPVGLRIVETPPDFLSSCCLLVDGEFVKQAGGIADPDFRGYGSEDVDLCWRVGERGGQVAKTGAAYVHHFFGASLDDNGLNRQHALQQANRILYLKWKNRLLRLVAQKVQTEGLDPVTYLESHFIYPALAKNTTFIEDVRQVLGMPELPEDLVWRQA